jgi:uncharacterized membrane protein YfcA
MLQEIVVLLIMFVAALMRTTFGFGNALIAMPLLLLWLPLPIASPLVALASFTLAIAMLSSSWQHVDWSALRPLLLTVALGIPLGVFVLRQLESDWLLPALGLLLAGFGLYRLFRPQLPAFKHPILTIGLGLLGGLFGGAYNTHGPPAILYGSMRRWSPEVFRASLQAYFLVTYALIMISHALSGLWTGQVGWLYLVSLPSVPLAVAVGYILTRRLSVERFEKLLNVALIGLGVTLMV